MKVFYKIWHEKEGNELTFSDSRICKRKETTIFCAFPTNVPSLTSYSFGYSIFVAETAMCCPTSEQERLHFTLRNTVLKKTIHESQEHAEEAIALSINVFIVSPARLASITSGSLLFVLLFHACFEAEINACRILS